MRGKRVKKTGSQQKEEQRASALQKIRALFDAAALAFSANPAQAHKLAAQAHRLMLRSKVKLPAVLKRRFCKQCRAFWVPGATVRVRLTKGKVVYTCLACKHALRMPLS